jgi:hypothetical protein
MNKGIKNKEMLANNLQKDLMLRKKFSDVSLSVNKGFFILDLLRKLVMSDHLIDEPRD